MTLASLKTRAVRLLPNNAFARSVSVLVGGTAGAQLLMVLASPLLTRLYTPDDFGLLAVYAGILGILGVIASLRYQLAIPLPESDKEAASIAILSLVTVVLTTAATAIATLFFGDEIVSALNTPRLSSYLWLIPTGMFLVGIYQVFQYWAIRKKSFPNIARTRINQSLGMIITQIAGYTLGPLALLLGRVVGQSAGIWGLARSAFSKNGDDFKATTSKDVREVAIRYKNFPKIATWTGLASSAGINLPPLLIASFLGAGPAGLFSLAHRVLSQPMTVIGKAVSDAFYQKAAESYRKGSLDKAVNDVFSILVKLALAPALVIFLVIPVFFTAIFGDSWVVAGEIARWMTPWLFFQFIVSPCTGIFPIINRHDIALRFQLSLLASSVFGALIGGLYFNSLTWTVILISFFSSLIYIWRAATTFKTIGLDKAIPIKKIIAEAPISFFIALPAFLAFAFSEENLIVLSTGVVGSIALWSLLSLKPAMTQQRRPI